ncbi:hypothetical protein HPE56_08465 [Maribacter sp. ANRC-HE7]|uniref:Uncharacterized protein n=1 Tax=Maribacter aquimaris TaxID=2737171 RepID=A0ABR7UYZ4_9FLAO|nr:hypothetical protein [Maribacter aquimaris]MBD0777824.1 hypothetical protein [Maribacter aquimaris]
MQYDIPISSGRRPLEEVFELAAQLVLSRIQKNGETILEEDLKLHFITHHEKVGILK